MDQYLIKMLKLNLHAHSMYQERKLARVQRQGNTGSRFQVNGVKVQWQITVLNISDNRKWFQWLGKTCIIVKVRVNQKPMSNFSKGNRSCVKIIRDGRFGVNFTAENCRKQWLNLDEVKQKLGLWSMMYVS